MKSLDELAELTFSKCLLIAHCPNCRQLSGSKCNRCGNNVTVAYHENRLYSVHCAKCETVTLLRAYNPYYAAEKAVN